MNGGDQLARGAKSAQFPASEGKISRERWDEIFKDVGSQKAPLKPQETGDPTPCSSIQP